jgi:hypothetical protein
VHAPGLPEVLDEALACVSPAVHVEGLAPQPGGDLVQLLVLQRYKSRPLKENINLKIRIENSVTK